MQQPPAPQGGGWGLLVTQRFDRVEVRGTQRRNHPAHQSDHDQDPRGHPDDQRGDKQPDVGIGRTLAMAL